MKDDTEPAHEVETRERRRLRAIHAAASASSSAAEREYEPPQPKATSDTPAERQRRSPHLQGVPIIPLATAIAELNEGERELDPEDEPSEPQEPSDMTIEELIWEDRPVATYDVQTFEDIMQQQPYPPQQPLPDVADPALWTEPPPGGFNRYGKEGPSKALEELIWLWLIRFIKMLAAMSSLLMRNQTHLIKGRWQETDNTISHRQVSSTIVFSENAWVNKDESRSCSEDQIH